MGEQIFERRCARIAHTLQSMAGIYFGLGLLALAVPFVVGAFIGSMMMLDWLMRVLFGGA